MMDLNRLVEQANELDALPAHGKGGFPILRAEL